MSIDTGLFSAYQVGSAALQNRIVMAPMTRRASPGGVPGDNVANYYARRAQNNVGLIITEGAWIDFPFAGNAENVPDAYSSAALAGWREVVRRVHEAKGRIFMQLWHTGVMRYPPPNLIESSTQEQLAIRVVSPSGVTAQGRRVGSEMSVREIGDLIASYARSAVAAKDVGFDGVEIHGAHGYLPDQFMSPDTNRRADAYGGGPRARGRFAGELVAECRRHVGKNFPISFRFSQWKLWNYDARSATSPQELEELLGPLAGAGVDLIHCSTRRFWVPEFEGSDKNLAGWVKCVTGVPTITCGSIGLKQEFLEGYKPGGRGGLATAEAGDLNSLLPMLARGDFDLVAVGRALLLDPAWARKVCEGRFDELQGYNAAALQTLT